MTLPPKYALTERIAQGGMAEIYLGKSIGVDGFSRICAFKRILPHYASDAEFIQMFKNEADVAKQLHNKNIVQVFDFVSDGNTFMLVMELVDGQDLRSVLATSENSRKRIPMEIACYICMEILSGLGYAHTVTDVSGRSLGLIHRDVSPQNILISYDGDVKLTDFGIAKAQNTGSTTRAGVLKGKFRYMSPEQARGQTIDSRSDLFAVGVILWEMITMQRLFRGEDMAVLEAVRQCKIKPPSAMSSEPIPVELDNIVMKLLSRDLSRRYQTGKEAVRDLSKFIYSVRPDFFGGELSEFMHQIFREKVLSAKDRLRSTLAIPVGAFSAGGVFEHKDSVSGKTNSGIIDLTDPKSRAAAAESSKAHEAQQAQKYPKAQKPEQASKPLPQLVQNASAPGPVPNGAHGGLATFGLKGNLASAGQPALQSPQNQPVQRSTQLVQKPFQRNRAVPARKRNRSRIPSSASSGVRAGNGTDVLLVIFVIVLIALGIGAVWVIQKKGSLRPTVAVIKVEPAGGPIDIQLNGKSLPRSQLKDSPLRIPLSGARQHKITLNRRGFKAKTLTIEVPLVGGAVERKAVLEPGAQPLINFEVTTTPTGAKVTLQGQAKSFRTPEVFKNIPVGQSYEIKLSHPKCKDVITDIVSLTETSARTKNLSRAYRFKDCKP